MKIVAGLGSIDDYVRLVKAGADEMFCGFVPYEWNKKYGNLFPLNRREVLYYNVHIGTLEDMKILKKMIDVYKVPVTIAFNYLYYVDNQYEIIADIIKDLIDIGFNEFIIADIALILYLKEKGIKCSIHLSGECAEINRLSIDFFNRFDNISRYIFHRKNTIEDMESCICRNNIKNTEYEAFILNERCHYTGAFCSSLHCDEMAHLCKMPYEMAKINEYSDNFSDVERRFSLYYSESEGEIGSECSYLNNQDIIKEYDSLEYDDEVDDTYKLGSTGCGLCSLEKLKAVGVTHLKVVGRGNFIDYMERDVRNLKKAINMLNNKNCDNYYKESIMEKLFCGKCSKECYY